VDQAITGNQINWNQVYYFSKIAAAGSIKEAAAQLDLSPSTLSLHLSQLESDLRIQLFFRQHRRLALTPEGSRLFFHAKAMFESGQRMIDLVSPIPLGSYPVSVGLVPSPSIQIANKILAAYLKKSALSMKLFRSGYAELEKGLVEARFDFGFSDRVPDRKDLACRRVSLAPVHFYVAQKWSEIPFSELLQKLPLLICNAEPERRSLAEQSLLESDLSPCSVVTSDYPGTLIDFCEQGIGIGVFSEKTLPGRLGKGLSELRAPKDSPKLKDSLYALWSKEAEGTLAVSSLEKILSEVNDAW